MFCNKILEFTHGNFQVDRVEDDANASPTLDPSTPAVDRSYDDLRTGPFRYITATGKYSFTRWGTEVFRNLKVSLSKARKCQKCLKFENLSKSVLVTKPELFTGTRKYTQPETRQFCWKMFSAGVLQVC